MSKEGKSFEQSIEKSCKDQGIFYHRIRDVFLPPDLRMRVRVPKNKYDAFCFHKGFLFALEFKSVNAKSINIKDPKIIKPHQTEGLKDADKFDNVIAGFIFNFRKDENVSYFVPIDKYVEFYKCLVTGSCPVYGSKLNKSSITIANCEEIGFKIESKKLKINHQYYMNDLIDRLIENYKK